MLVSKKPTEPTRTLKCVLPPMRTPNARRWNIGRIGSSCIEACIGHVHSMFFVLISFALGTQRKPVFRWNMGSLEVISYLTDQSFSATLQRFPSLTICLGLFPLDQFLYYSHAHLPHPPPHNHPHPNLIAPPPSSGKPQNHAIKINPVHNQVTSKDTPYLHGPGLPSPPGRGVPLRPPGRLPRPPTVSPTPWSESWDSLEVTGGEVTVLSRGSDRCYCQPLATPPLLSVLCMRYGKPPARLVVATTPLALALSPLPSSLPGRRCRCCSCWE